MTDTMTGAPARNYVGGEWRESVAGETYEKRNPWRPSQVTGVYPASDAEDARAAIEAARAAFPAWSSLPRRTAGRDLREGGRGDRGASRAGRPGHDRGDGKAAARGPARDASRRHDPPLRGRRGVPPDRRAVRAVGRRPATLHATAPRRRRRPDHAVELPDRDPGVEARAGADLREHARAQAGVRGAAHRTARGRVLRRSGAARRRAERAHRGGLEGRGRDRLEPRRARDLVHGLGAGRPLRARRGDCARLPRPARARRAQPADRHGVGGARSGRRSGVRRRLLVGRAEVHGDAAHPRRRVRLRRVSREAARPR